jgi:hypothetical protein
MILEAPYRKYLIALARQEVVRSVAGIKENPVEQVSDPGSSLRGGAFVSLYVQEELRGCIGTFEEDQLLIESVGRMARAAALTDTRFPPLERAELNDLKIEISALGPRKAINGPEDIEVGRHGIFIRSGSNRGTFLPQVAKNQGWNALQFLEHCSKYKAGLDWEGWKDAELYVYEAVVFSSEDLL